MRMGSLMNRSWSSLIRVTAIAFSVIPCTVGLAGVTHGQVESYKVLHRFVAAPLNPISSLLQGTDGNFYGTSSRAGPFPWGGVFKLTPDGTVTTLHVFGYDDGSTPWAPLIQGRDGNFYGTTSDGGMNYPGYGTVFKLTPDGTFTTLHVFTGGSGGSRPRAALIQAADGNLYGTTSGVESSPTDNGTVFKLTPDGTFTTLHVFSSGSGGASPRAPLIQARDGNFYGATHSGGSLAGGTVFKLTPDGTFTTLYAFSWGSDGAIPSGGLLEGPDGSFYGTTSYYVPSSGGGAVITQSRGLSGSSIPTTRFGTVFKLTPDGILTTLYAFTGEGDGAYPSAGVIRGSDGALYGTTTSTVFKLTMDGTFTMLHSFTGDSDGSDPSGGLIQGTDGTLYGVTKQGGPSGAGTMYMLMSTGAFATVYAFTPDSQGAQPLGAPVQTATGDLYGTASTGGPANCGTVFRLGSNGILTTLHMFTGADGCQPQAGLLVRADGALYGTTRYGGTSNLGTVFKLAPEGTLTTLHTFSGGSNGAYPQAPLIQGTDGNLYGMTYEGADSNHNGTLFRLTPSGGQTTLYVFTRSSVGAHPVGGLFQASDGNFYGMTSGGGPSTLYRGTVFRLTPDGALTTIYAFSGSDGAIPSGRLIQASDGNLYGMSFSGGSSNLGTIFRLTMAGTLTTLYTFSGGSDGRYPSGGIIQAGDGNLYGTTYSGGTLKSGTVFKLSLGGTLSTIHTFNKVDGALPGGGLLEGPGGVLYGYTSRGGWPTGGGVLFALGTTNPLLSVGLLGTGSGTVISGPVGIACGATCVAAYAPGTTVNLTTTPAPGSIFTGWSGDCTGTDPCTVTMTQARSVTATFQLLTVSVTITTDPTGKQITVDGQTYTAPQSFEWIPGSVHTLGVPSPQSGPSGTRYLFGSWSNAGSQSHTVMAPVNAATYTAAFLTQHLLSISVSPDMGGTVAPSPAGDTAGLACIALLGVICPAYYDSGTSVTLTAIPDTGHAFTGWSGDLTGPPNPAFVLMDGPKNVIANFASQLPILALGLNTSILHTGNTLTLTATVTPGATTTFTDVYVALALPGGMFLFLQGDGSLTTEVRPVVSHWTVGPYSGPIFTHHFDGWEPVGSYMWYAAFTNPGQSPFLGTIGPVVMAPFSFDP